jgi:hypothetical protein
MYKPRDILVLYFMPGIFQCSPSFLITGPDCALPPFSRIPYARYHWLAVKEDNGVLGYFTTKVTPPPPKQAGGQIEQSVAKRQAGR